MVSIALSKQVHIYSVDTDFFYNIEEEKIHRSLNARYLYRGKLNKKRASIERRLNKMEKDGFNKFFMYSDMKLQLKIIGKRYAIVDGEIGELKNKLKSLLNDNSKKRSIRLEKLKSRNIVSIFDSALVRYMGLEYGALTREIMIVQTYYFKPLEDIIKNGFMYGKDEFIPFTASAGQIRTKKTLFIKKTTYEKIEQRLTCGLSTSAINACGGVNINKYLAYLALSNSATEKWTNFDIRKSIVVNDLETAVGGLVDYIDRDDYSIVRKEMNVPIEHTDGCGMMLKDVNSKAMMVRLPWVKGLLVPFPFDKFIREHNRNNPMNKIGKIKDIYGKEYDILQDDIEVIFTKSQFKMWKYYNSWEEYQDIFTYFDCQAGYCNEEPDSFSDAKLNYQMLQTLMDVTVDELKELASTTIYDIQKMGTSRETMLKVLGVTPSNSNKNHFQQALEIYPELLRDQYSKQVIKQTKSSMIEKARAGRIDIQNSKYTFIIPDLYAFCEFLFLGIENPKGILENGRVSCKLYNDNVDLDCLRSPHLYREHAVRKNQNNDETKRWFISHGLYISSHDLISKILQCDFDGDTSLVVDNDLFVNIAKRNMQGIVPLYYEMKTAKAEQISSNSVYSGLENAYKGGNIGIVSNNITKIWNSGDVDLDVVKLLCLENNFIIDRAKTSYMPSRPPKINKVIKSHTKNKLPYFFMYAKDKKRNQVEKRNKSTVNLLKEIIPNTPINFSESNVGKFDYKLLMSDSSIKLNTDDNELIELYKKLDLYKYFMINHSDEKVNNLSYTYQNIREELLDMEHDIDRAVDVLVKYLYKYKKSNYKTTLWECFGDVMVHNLKVNINKPLDNGWVQCEVCGERVNKTNNKSIYCQKCSKKVQIEQIRQWKRINMEKIEKVL